MIQLRTQNKFSHSGQKNALIDLSFVFDLLKRKCVLDERKKLKSSKASRENDVPAKIIEQNTNSFVEYL